MYNPPRLEVTPLSPGLSTWSSSNKYLYVPVPVLSIMKDFVMYKLINIQLTT